MYLIIEIQKNIDGTCANIVQTAETVNEAESKYHAILSFAAVSEIYCHSATMLMDDGSYVKHEAYWHVPEEGKEEEDESVQQ